MRLADKIAVVTGAGRGIGAAIALTLAKEGAKVVVNYSRSAEAAEQVVAQILAAGGEAVAVQGSVAVPAEAEALIKARRVRHASQLFPIKRNLRFIFTMLVQQRAMEADGINLEAFQHVSGTCACACACAQTC